MNEHPTPPPPPPPRRIVVLPTATAVLTRTTSIFFTRKNFLMFLVLSILLSFQRLNIDMATNTLTSYIDNQSSIQSFFSRTHEPPNPTTITAVRRPFLQLPLVGTLDNDFFTEDDEFDRRSLPNPQSNSTSFILDSSDSQLGFSNSVSNNDINASEINDSAPIDETAESKSDSQSLKTSDLERHGFTALFFPFGAFCASYGYLVLGFVSTYAYIHGVIFVLVLNDFCMRYNSFIGTYLNGCSLGLKRLCRNILMRWIIRSVFSLLLGICFFGQIEDKHTLVKIFVRLIFMPYSIFSPWVKGFEKEREDFILPWLFVDFLTSFALTLDPWIVMADPRRNWREVVQEGWNLLSLSLHLAYNLKSFESIVCGPYVRWVFARTFGDFFARALHCFMEVYFMVAWLMYYLSVKSIHANSSGQPFGQRELEAMLGDVR
ncbi:uncharacterized protein LOC111894064 [Lactuca sativa]|uniref:uncharacterized protein LOC111894064 n=1 Tax=Lactuca sativa TaxID=4236 RepID=UPI000CB66BBF|nr:uncharacterized protein LOC111894064 [Lactuca sativa]